MMDEYEFDRTDEGRQIMAEIESESLGYLHNTEDSILLSGKALADLLGIAPPSLTEAVQKKNRSKGYLVHNWAATNENGRIMEYHVPLNIYKELKGRSPGGFSPGRDNPDSSGMDVASDIEQLAGDSAGVHSPTSLLPEGQDYHRSVGLASGAYVLRNLLDTEKPQGKAFSVALLSGGLALGGKIVFENNSAGVAGGVIGLLIGLLYLENPFTQRLREQNKQLQDSQRTKRVFVPVSENKSSRKESQTESMHLV